MKLRIHIPVVALCVALCFLAAAGAAMAAKTGQPTEADSAPPTLKDFRRSAPVIPALPEDAAAGTDGATRNNATAPSGATRNNGTTQTNATRADTVEGALFQVILPPEVFLDSLRGDASDLCVFNAEGKVLPFAVRRQDQREIRATSTLDKLYPLWGKPQSAPEELAVSFSLDAQGRIVPRLSGGRELNEAPQGQELKGYVIPMPESDMPISSMSFTWDKGADNTVQFTLQTGDDLKSWRTLVSRAALVRFEGPDGMLDSSLISLNGARADKYLRLVFDPGLAPARIRSVSVEQWSSVRPLLDYGPILGRFIPEQPAKDKQPAVPAGLEYVLAFPENASPQEGEVRDANGSLPLESLQLYEPKPGQYASVRVLTREDGKAAWRYLGDYTFFAVTRGGDLLQSKPMPLGGRRVGQIRLESAALNRALPDDLAFSVTYMPQELSFLAQGPGPYILAWKGERPGARDDRGLFTLMGQGGDVRRATLGEVSATPTPPQEASYDWAKGNWLKFVLWGLLGLGVLLLGGMALKLAKSMKKD